MEGGVVRMWNVNTSSSSKGSQFLQLSASRNTRFQPVRRDSTALVGYRPRECVSIGRLVRGEGVWYGEMDTVGIVVGVTSEQVGGAR